MRRRIADKCQLSFGGSGERERERARAARGAAERERSAGGRHLQLTDSVQSHYAAGGPDIVESGVETKGTGGGGLHCTPKFRTCTPRTSQVKDAAYVKILSKRL